MRRSDTPSASRRELLIFALPAFVLIAAAFVLAWQFVRPAPPKKIVISTGAPGGAYHYFGERYREKLAQVLLNLLSNAVKFTEPGGRVMVAAEAPNRGEA